MGHEDEIEDAFLVRLTALLDSIIITRLQRIEDTMATSDEVAAVQAAADDIKAGVQRVVDALAAARAAGNQPDPALEAAVAELQASAGQLDSAVPAPPAG